MDVTTIFPYVVGGAGLLAYLYAYFRKGAGEATILIQSKEIDALQSYNTSLEKKLERLTAENEGLKRENATLKSNPIVLDKIVGEIRKLTTAVNKQANAVSKLAVTGAKNGK